MIRLTTAPPHTGAEKEVSLNIDNIMLVQRQTPVTGSDFTAIFFNVAGNPPYRVTETEVQVYEKVREARAFRAGAKVATFDFTRKQ